jgi:hypothetical protein
MCQARRTNLLWTLDQYQIILLLFFFSFRSFFFNFIHNPVLKFQAVYWPWMDCCITCAAACLFLQASALEKALLDLEALAGGYYEFDTLAPSMAYTNPDLGIAAQQRCMFSQYSFVRLLLSRSSSLSWLR